MDEEKKTERKIKRFTARLKSSKGILCTDVEGPVSTLQYTFAVCLHDELS